MAKPTVNSVLLAHTRHAMREYEFLAAYLLPVSKQVTITLTSTENGVYATIGNEIGARDWNDITDTDD